MDFEFIISIRDKHNRIRWYLTWFEPEYPVNTCYDEFGWISSDREPAFVGYGDEHYLLKDVISFIPLKGLQAKPVSEFGK